MADPDGVHPALIKAVFRVCRSDGTEALGAGGLKMAGR